MCIRDRFKIILGNISLSKTIEFWKVPLFLGMHAIYGIVMYFKCMSIIFRLSIVPRAGLIWFGCHSPVLAGWAPVPVLATTLNR